ncbi:MAG: GNAT family N-acetyltransferase [Candidatus Obscuribacterales bacterium]|nr:GNAT family N-acetyltransferase [Candidatus Obscuribacterales bacterium]
MTNASSELVGVELEKLNEKTALLSCARMMVSSNPWNALYFTEEQCLNDLNNPALQIFGAVSEAKDVVGFLASMANGIGFEPMIEYLCVRDDCRGRGVGTKLIGHFEDVLFPNADNLYLFVSDINPKAIELYVRLGYLQVGALPNFNLVGQTEFLHRKSRRPKQQKSAELNASVC